ncbi:S26 family signal peptidase [Extibacter muris]|uniref:S26 family signal peptidase n=1 Tax=Extibacter muris TaxID=1796622 RepID=UPI0011AE8136|nr:S26 family signal peptidase [Extibacter muris]
MQFFAEQLKEWTGYQTFVILTDSMVPTIPVDSLVVVKDLGEKEELSQGEIISFYVDRLGDKVVFTIYFEKKK